MKKNKCKLIIYTKQGDDTFSAIYYFKNKQDALNNIDRIMFMYSNVVDVLIEEDNYDNV